MNTMVFFINNAIIWRKNNMYQSEDSTRIFPSHFSCQYYSFSRRKILRYGERGRRGGIGSLPTRDTAPNLMPEEPKLGELA